MNPADWSEGSQWLLVLAYIVGATALIGEVLRRIAARRNARWNMRLRALR